MNQSKPPLNSPTQLRKIHLALLKQLEEDGQEPSKDLLVKIEAYQAAAKSTGAIIVSPDERSDIQSTINFWMNIMYNNGLYPEKVLIDDFDPDAAGAMDERSSPYNGLKPFQIGDAKFFFGRSQALRQMQGILEKKRMLAVTGLSGSGKSSVVRGGLLPRLQEGAAPGSEDWLYLPPIMPGADPIASLEKLTGGKIGTADDFVNWLDAKEASVVISVDQFEEAYTLSENAEPLALFLDALVAATDPETNFPHRVIITIRSEFDDNVAAHDGFNNLFKAGRVRLDALAESELREVIELPAKQFGVEVEVELVHELVQRMVGVTAGLPLLQFTLQELWLKREGGKLKFEDYKSLGGDPRIILTDRADKEYESLLPQQQRLTKDIFLKLIKIEDMDAKSRRMKRTEITAPRDDVDVLLSIWREKGFLRISPVGSITPESEIEVAHEALIRNWRRFESWIREGLREHLNLSAFQNRAERWMKNGGRIGDELLGLSDIGEAEGLLERFEQTSPELQEYVSLSRVEVDKKQQVAESKAKRWRTLARLVYSGGFLLITWIVLFFAPILIFDDNTLESSNFDTIISWAALPLVVIYLILFLQSLRVVGSDLVEAASTISFLPFRKQPDTSAADKNGRLPFYKRPFGRVTSAVVIVFCLVLLGVAPTLVITLFAQEDAEALVIANEEKQELENLLGREQTQLFRCTVFNDSNNQPNELTVTAIQTNTKAGYELRYEYGQPGDDPFTLVGDANNDIVSYLEDSSPEGTTKHLMFENGDYSYIVYSLSERSDDGVSTAEKRSGVLVVFPGDKTGNKPKLANNQCDEYQSFNLANNSFKLDGESFDLMELKKADPTEVPIEIPVL